MVFTFARRSEEALFLSAKVVGACLSCMIPTFAFAQAKCPAGRTSSGACVNAGLTSSMEQRAVVFSQPNLSFLGPPLAYGDNGYIDASRNRQALSNGIDMPVKSSTAVTPAPGTFIGLPSNVNPANLNIAAPFTVVPGGIRIK